VRSARNGLRASFSTDVITTNREDGGRAASAELLVVQDKQGPYGRSRRDGRTSSPNIDSYSSTLSSSQDLRTGVDPNTPGALASFFDGDRFKADWQGNLNLAPGQVLTLRAEHQRDAITVPVAEISA
jgi:hypothetical protein